MMAGERLTAADKENTTYPSYCLISIALSGDKQLRLLSHCPHVNHWWMFTGLGRSLPDQSVANAGGPGWFYPSEESTRWRKVTRYRRMLPVFTYGLRLPNWGCSLAHVHLFMFPLSPVYPTTLTPTCWLLLTWPASLLWSLCLATPTLLGLPKTVHLIGSYLMGIQLLPGRDPVTWAYNC